MTANKNIDSTGKRIEEIINNARCDDHRCSKVLELNKEATKQIQALISSQVEKARVVNRFEVVDHTSSGAGREFVKWLGYDFQVDLLPQDDDRTLKVFLLDIKTKEGKADDTKV